MHLLAISPQPHRLHVDTEHPPSRVQLRDSGSFLADFISAPTLIGFKAGTGLLIAAGQLGKVLGGAARGRQLLQQGRLDAEESRSNQLGRRQRSRPPASPSSSRCVAGSTFVPGFLLVVALGMLAAAGTGLADRRVDLVVDLSPVPDIDITALDEPSRIRCQRARAWHHPVVGNTNARLLDMIRRIPNADRWKSQLFRDVKDAAEAYTARRRREVPVNPRNPTREG